MMMKRISLRMPDELHEEASVLAEATGRSLNQLVLDALEREVKDEASTAEGKERIRAHLRAMAERFGLDDEV